MEPLRDEDLAEIEARLVAACAVAPLPWRVWLESEEATGGGSFIQIGGATDSDDEIYVELRLNGNAVVSPDHRLDAVLAMIGESAQDLTRLLQEVRRLRDRLPDQPVLTCRSRGCGLELRTAPITRRRCAALLLCPCAQKPLIGRGDRCGR